MARSATSARSTGLRSTIWLSLRASSSRPSTSCSLRSLVARRVLPSWWSSGGAPGSEMDLQQGAVDRQRGAQLVRGVADEPLLCGEGPLQPVQHVVEGVRQLLQLVVRAVQLDPPGEVRAGHPARGPGDPAERGQDASGHGVSEGEGHHAEADQGEEGPVEQAVQRLLPLGRRTGLDRVVQLVVVEGGAQLRAGVAGDLDIGPGDPEGHAPRVVERLRGQHVDDRQQHDARDQEHPAVQQREPYPDGRAQPGVRGSGCLGSQVGFGGAAGGSGVVAMVLRSGIRSPAR